MDELIRVFVASREKELRTERVVTRAAIEGLRWIRPVLAEFDLPESRMNIEAYLEELEKCHLVLILLDEKLGERGVLYPPLRKELEKTLERGVPFLVFLKGPEKKATRARIVTDYVEYLKQKGAQVALFHDDKQLEIQVPESILYAIYSRFLSGPKIVKDRKEMYEEAAQMLRNAKDRVLFAQRTPLLIFGPTDYPWQVRAFEALCGWLSQVRRLSSTKQFVMIYSEDDVETEFKKHGKQLTSEYPYFLGIDLKRGCALKRPQREVTHEGIIRVYKERIEFLREVEMKSGKRFRFRSIRKGLNPLLIVDSSTGFAVPLLGTSGIMYRETIPSVANILFDDILEDVR